MSLEIAFTDAGLAFRREALKNGVPIKITHFKISKDDIDMSSLPTDLPSNWIEKPITYYTPIGTTGLQLDLWVNADEAIEQGKSFGVYLEDGTCYMLGRAVGLFNPNLKQKYKVLIEFVNSDLSSYDLNFVENLQQDWELIKNKPSFSLINTPTISVAENRAIVGYATNNTFNGVHDKTLIKLYEDENRTNLLKEYEVTSVDVANVLLSDIPANTQLWGTLQVGSDNHLSDVVEFEFTSMDKAIESPVFTVETDNGKAVNLADVTLNALPTATNCTIDTVEFQIIKVSDNTVIDTQTTTNLTLPIVFESQNLIENTEYKWEVRCRDTSLNVDSAWSSVQLFTTETFSTLAIFDFFEDNSAVSLNPFDGNANDAGGLHNGVWTAQEAYVSTDKEQGASFIGATNKIVKVSLGQYTLTEFAISIFIKDNDYNKSCMPIWIEDVGFIYFHLNDILLYHNIYLYDQTSSLNLRKLDNDTHHYVFNYKADVIEIFIDNVLSGTISHVNTEFTANISLGGSYATSYNMNATIDHCRIFNRALTQAEVAQLFEEK